eukprot:Protomagalhaensia_sp_Gyna_25__972@NODE_146_length_4895_cov_17_531507_g113_i0_p1_GENE_NODE_146_length_4895_cov_17_531507_g113_i0NODE_146_length_4895_cov_17_531507_g113_i0_p1_ORF_typecomplete_len442_score112_65RED_N/PF07808_13/4e03RED_N/PF07808_13/6_4e14Baculo_LEF2/PF03041_14/0_016GspL_C/PF12693_7/0_14DUF4670/PF15709_5/46DUF4670/PF15709_5/0_034_NODE_146_length_4895_cov_17_531507_g113_i020333358
MKNQDFRNAIYAEEQKRQALKKKKKTVYKASAAASSDEDEDAEESPSSIMGAKHKGDMEEEEEDKEHPKEESDYVDRAALRRQMEKRLQQTATTTGAGGGAAANDKSTLTFSQIMGSQSNLTPEEMKMLGGDEEHTYLVKGLDLALLAKARQEIKEAERRRQSVLKERSSDTVASSQIKDAWAQDIVEAFTRNLNRHCRGFKKQLELFGEHISRGGRFTGNTDLFNRTYYLFDGSSNQPTTLFRSAKVVSDLDSLMSENDIAPRLIQIFDKGLLDSISRVCSGAIKLRPTESSLSPSQTKTVTFDLKIQEPQNQNESLHPPPKEASLDEEDDDGIFPDAGGLDTAELARKSMAERSENEVERRKKIQAELRRQEREEMEAAETLMGSAAKLRESEEAQNQALLENKKRSLERPEPVPSDQNPFSLKNASLIPLVKKPRTGH